MNQANVFTLDLKFRGLTGAIASYLIPHSSGAVLVECGPGSTIPGLTAGLAAHGYKPADITDVLLTHIHLDHAGASGWMARQGARIHVHPKGAPHLENPEKLLASAKRIYGDQMEELWGEFLPVPSSSLDVLADGQVIEIGELRFKAYDTPGHANHHIAYGFGDLLFSGDIGGVRLGGTHQSGFRHIELPMPPPEFHLETWRSSVHRLQEEGFRRIAPIHFGIYPDASWHLTKVERGLDEIECWMEKTMPADPPIEKLREQLIAWSRQRALDDGVSAKELPTFEAANPVFMSADGIARYWKKYRQPGE